MKFKETDIINIVIAGTAGQGVITLKRLIEYAAQKAGIEVILGAEQHGLAQREGAIISHTRYQKMKFENERRNLQSPLICYGDADLYICIEPSEVLRRGIYASKKTSFVLNSRTIPGIMSAADLEIYPSLDKIKEIIGVYSDDFHFLNATEISLNQFKTNQQANLIMLGFALPTSKIPFIDMTHYEEVIKEWLREPDNNIKALNIGYNSGLKMMS